MGLAQEAFGEVGRGEVGAGIGLAVAGEVFGAGEDVLGVDEGRVVLHALEADDGGDAHLAGEVGALAEHLVEAAETRLAGEV